MFSKISHPPGNCCPISFRWPVTSLKVGHQLNWLKICLSYWKLLGNLYSLFLYWGNKHHLARLIHATLKLISVFRFWTGNIEAKFSEPNLFMAQKRGKVKQVEGRENLLQIHWIQSQQNSTSIQSKTMKLTAGVNTTNFVSLLCYHYHVMVLEWFNIFRKCK